MAEEKKKTIASIFVGTVNTELLNMRLKPSFNAEVILVLKKNEEVTVSIKGSANDWYKITTAGLSGYCLKEFITRVD